MRQSTYPNKDWPRLPDGRIDQKTLKGLFFESNCTIFAHFARERGFPLKPYPSTAFVEKIEAEKRNGLLSEKRDFLKEGLFNYKASWGSEVIKTLREYPKLIDDAKQIVTTYLQEVAKEIIEQKKKEERGEAVDKKFYQLFKPGDIVSLSMAVERLTNAKHKSLLLDRWTIEGSVESLESLASGQIESLAQRFEITIPGHKGQLIDASKIEERLKSFYDQPIETTAQEVKVDNGNPTPN